jgi:hypothetical protein
MRGTDESLFVFRVVELFDADITDFLRNPQFAAIAFDNLFTREGETAPYSLSGAQSVWPVRSLVLLEA